MATTTAKMVTCSPACASGLRTDDQQGAIYGPYAERQPDGSLRFLTRVEWAALTERCVYCSGPLPRGRAARLTRKYLAH